MYAFKREMKRITGSNYLVKTSCDMEVAMAYAKEVASEYNEIRQYGATDSEILFEIDNFVKRYYEGCDMDALKLEMKRITGTNYN